MGYRHRGILRRAGVAGSLAALACTAWADTSPGKPASESAVWTPRQTQFIFLGFTAHYSCDGLADKMRQVLLKLGARPDLQVSPMPCGTPFGRPDPFPGVTVKMNVLQPVHGTDASAGAVPAHWVMVDVNSALSKDPLAQSGQCELLEQIKQSILPQFAVRNVRYKSTCVPHQLDVGGTQLQAEVLVADNPRAAVEGAPAPSAPAASVQAPAAPKLFLYPRNGQSEAQTQKDRAECSGWAVSQSGYDPSRPGQQAAGSAADYVRAMTACLDARGYSVH